MFAEFLSVHPVDYAFVCIDQRADSDSPRQDVVYAALSEAGVSFHRFRRQHNAGQLRRRGRYHDRRLRRRLSGVAARRTECQRSRQSSRLSQRATSGSERVGGVACGDGMAAAHGAVCFRNLLRPSTSSGLRPRALSGLTPSCAAREPPSHLRRHTARLQRNQGRRTLDQPQVPDCQPALSLRLWRSDGPVSPPKPVARAFRWQVGLPRRSHGWIRVGRFRLRQPLFDQETTPSFGHLESIQAVIRSMPKSSGRG